MGRCEYCKKTHIKSSGLSFHRFPEDEKLKLKWVENMGRTSWTPAKCSLLCSSHFNRNCMDLRDSRVRLRKGSVPTIFKHNVGNDHSVVNTDASSQTFAEHPHIKGANSTYEKEIMKADKQILQAFIRKQPIIERSAERQFSHTQTKVNLNAVNHDHVYDDPPDIVRQKLGVARMKIKKLTHENHVLRQKAKRARKTINSMKNLLSQLRDSKQLCHNENNANRIHVK